ncbi:hypothetical protein [Chamaesiphon sp. VAR_69_metabat_338]|uniref:hypothetical protein n=1 Tax=Chamaesiphon sp. VAR_69_metabat_338 TaxID=2964704 RepID=UPI00286DE659|nr:hypothetical protein [Chamaesiphon sp. VAR_69_metabat_338]
MLVCSILEKVNSIVYPLVRPSDPIVNIPLLYPDGSELAVVTTPTAGVRAADVGVAALDVGNRRQGIWLMSDVVGDGDG